MPQIPRRHHYIPEFYLKRWQWRDGPLVEYSKPHGDAVKPKRVFPKATGFMDRLYELRGLPPEEAQRYESGFFKPVDDAAAVVLGKFEADDLMLNDNERSAWSNFVMSLVLRNPEHVEAFRKEMADDVAKDVHIARRGGFRVGGREADEDRIRRELSTDEGIARVALTTLANTIISRRVDDFLISMHWGLVRAPIFAPALLTSDRPVLWEHTLDDERFRLMLPVGPKLVFFAVQNNPVAAAKMMDRGPSEVVAELNDHVTRRAVRFVYGKGDSALAYVQARMGVDPRPTLIDRLLETRQELKRRRLHKDRSVLRRGPPSLLG